MARSGDRVETFAMRVSHDEHVKLVELARAKGVGAADLVREAVNHLARAIDRQPVFREK